MDTHRLCVKFYAEKDFNILDTIPVFHQWIKDDRIADHVLIDVADYAHVFQGPGIMVVAHEANYSLDQKSGRLGLFYQRKQPFSEATGDQAKSAIRFAAAACRQLESDLPEAASFNGGEMMICVNDRNAAPNTEDALAELETAVKPALDALYGESGYETRREEVGRERPALHVKASGGASIGVGDVLTRLG